MRSSRRQRRQRTERRRHRPQRRQRPQRQQKKPRHSKPKKTQTHTPKKTQKKQGKKPVKAKLWIHTEQKWGKYPFEHTLRLKKVMGKEGKGNGKGKRSKSGKKVKKAKKTSKLLKGVKNDLNKSIQTHKVRGINKPTERQKQRWQNLNDIGEQMFPVTMD
eukprot:108383_1